MRNAADSSGLKKQKKRKKKRLHPSRKTRQIQFKVFTKQKSSLIHLSKRNSFLRSLYSTSFSSVLKFITFPWHLELERARKVAQSQTVDKHKCPAVLYYTQHLIKESAASLSSRALTCTNWYFWPFDAVGNKCLKVERFILLPPFLVSTTSWGKYHCPLLALKCSIVFTSSF